MSISCPAIGLTLTSSPWSAFASLVTGLSEIAAKEHAVSAYEYLRVAVDGIKTHRSAIHFLLTTRAHYALRYLHPPPRANRPLLTSASHSSNRS